MKLISVYLGLNIYFTGTGFMIQVRKGILLQLFTPKKTSSSQDIHCLSLRYYIFLIVTLKR